MNTQDDLDDIPFVNEECGDTMWDENRLNLLTQSMAPQQVDLVPSELKTTNQSGERVEEGTIGEAIDKLA